MPPPARADCHRRAASAPVQLGCRPRAGRAQLHGAGDLAAQSAEDSQCDGARLPRLCAGSCDPRHARGGARLRPHRTPSRSAPPPARAGARRGNPRSELPALARRAVGIGLCTAAVGGLRTSADPARSAAAGRVVSARRVAPLQRSWRDRRASLDLRRPGGVPRVSARRRATQSSTGRGDPVLLRPGGGMVVVAARPGHHRLRHLDGVSTSRITCRASVSGTRCTATMPTGRCSASGFCRAC